MILDKNEKFQNKHYKHLILRWERNYFTSRRNGWKFAITFPESNSPSSQLNQDPSVTYFEWFRQLFPFPFSAFIRIRIRRGRLFGYLVICEPCCRWRAVNSSASLCSYSYGWLSWPEILLAFSPSFGRCAISYTCSRCKRVGFTIFFFFFPFFFVILWIWSLDVLLFWFLFFLSSYS